MYIVSMSFCPLTFFANLTRKLQGERAHSLYFVSDNTRLKNEQYRFIISMVYSIFAFIAAVILISHC